MDLFKSFKPFKTFKSLADGRTMLRLYGSLN